MLLMSRYKMILLAEMCFSLDLTLNEVQPKYFNSESHQCFLYMPLYTDYLCYNYCQLCEGDD